MGDRLYIWLIIDVATVPRVKASDRGAYTNPNTGPFKLGNDQLLRQPYKDSFFIGRSQLCRNPLL